MTYHGRMVENLHVESARRTLDIHEAIEALPGDEAGVRAVVQRVLGASVVVDGETVGAIDGPGLLVYLGVTHDDGPADVVWIARKIWDLRILRDEQSASDVGAPVLVVSQFTLYGDARKGRRPTWQAAAPGPVSEPCTTRSARSSAPWAPRSRPGSSAPTCR